jgi:hypothetical protein
MGRLLRLIIALSVCFTSLACACYSGVAGAYHQSGRQFLSQGELGQASVKLHNVMGIGAREFDSVIDLIGVTPEPVSLALFGFGLTLAGVALLRCARRTKWSTSTRDARFAVDKSCVRLARVANGVQYTGRDIPARGQFVTTYVSSGSE